MGGGQNLLKNLRPLHLMKIYQMRPLLAWSISLDSTFNILISETQPEHFHDFCVTQIIKAQLNALMLAVQYGTA